MGKKSLQLQQLNAKMRGFVALQKATRPTVGWIKAIRSTLGISMQQLGKKLAMSKQAVLAMEKREQEGAITLHALTAFANAMDMQLVYGFVPNDGSLDALIEKRAIELATRIVMRTTQTMKLEDQVNSARRIEAAIVEKAAELRNEMPKQLWD